jgi:cytochrome c5
MAGFSKCDCEQCGMRIEFPAEAAGATVACPHCQAQTPLRAGPAGLGRGAAVPAKGGRRVGGLVALVVGVLIAGSLGGWAAYKKFSPGKIAPGTASGQRPVSAKDSGAAVTSAAAVAPQQLMAAAATSGEIKKGRDVYTGKCAKCHQFYDPAAYNDFDWNHWMGRMRGEAKLNGDQAELLNRFLGSLRNP